MRVGKREKCEKRFAATEGSALEVRSLRSWQTGAIQSIPKCEQISLGERKPGRRLRLLKGVNINLLQPGPLPDGTPREHRDGTEQIASGLDSRFGRGGQAVVVRLGRKPVTKHRQSST